MKLNINNVKYIIKLALILLAITFVCTALLAVVNSFTKEIIANNKAVSEENARIEVLANAKEFTDAYDKIALFEFKIPVTSVYEGKADGETVGYTVSVSPSGYGGAIELVVGVDTDYNITGINIISMSETPGLGAKIKDDSFTSGIIGKNAKDGISVVKGGSAKDNEINAISGATISSRAVSDGINTAIGAIKHIRERGDV